MRVYLTLKRRTNKQGLSEAYVVVYSKRGERKLIKTDVRIKPEQWNEEKREVRRSHPQNVALNQILWRKRNEMELRINAARLENPDFNYDDFIYMIDGVRRPSSEPRSFEDSNRKTTFWQAYDDYVERITPDVSASTIKDYHSL